MQAREPVLPGRTPEDVNREDVLSVIGPDGRINPDADPKLDTGRIVRLYEAMVRTRAVDRHLERLQRQGRVGFHVGSLGEEAGIIASAAALHERDWVFPSYRELGVLLWRGLPLQRYIDQMYGNRDDPAQGRQMPDHHTGKNHRVASVSSPAGTQIGHAVGFAWAARIKSDDLVTCVYFGDGATSSNDFHTGMNFAGVFKTPTIFLCRNNRWATSAPSEAQVDAPVVADKAIAYGVTGVRCDGNDALATYRVVRDARQRAIDGQGPTLVEVLTYRLDGNSTSDESRGRRAEDDVKQWRLTDPIVRLRRHLESLGAWSDDKEQDLISRVRNELDACVERAENKDKPSLSSLFEDVYTGVPWHLREQRDQLLAGPRAKSRR